MANMFPVVNTDIRMPKSMMEALSLFETQCVMLKIEEVNLEDVLDFLTKNYDKNFGNKFKIEYLYPINHLDSSINKRGFKYEVQHGLKIDETPDVEF
jgi:hypothetical protein